MRAKPLLPVLLLIVAVTAAASQFPDKPRPAPGPAAAAAAASRGGGETIETAVAILALPYTGSGTTAGAVDDYDEACPFPDSESPDVVYAYTPPATGPISLDLCHSSYDTKLYVYDETRELVACNDDFHVNEGSVCGLYSSKIEYVELSGLSTYYIVVDGYDGDAGEYVLDVDTTALYEMSCPPGIRAEGEPPLQNGTQDLFNGGCSGGPMLFQSIAGGLDGEVRLCVQSGWRLGLDGLDFDTDWLVATVGPEGRLHCEFDADWTTTVYATTSVGCSGLELLGICVGGRGELGGFDVVEAPGSTVWLYILPSSPTPPTGAMPYQYDIDLTVTGLEPTAAADEGMSWGGVKSLYR